MPVVQRKEDEPLTVDDDSDITVDEVSSGSAQLESKHPSRIGNSAMESNRGQSRYGYGADTARVPPLGPVYHTPAEQGEVLERTRAVDCWEKTHNRSG
jgi:hypothetical protein